VIYCLEFCCCLYHVCHPSAHEQVQVRRRESWQSGGLSLGATHAGYFRSHDAVHAFEPTEPISGCPLSMGLHACLLMSTPRESSHERGEVGVCQPIPAVPRKNFGLSQKTVVVHSAPPEPISSIIRMTSIAYTMNPLATPTSALMTLLVAAPNLTLSTSVTNLTSSTLHFLILPTLTQAPFSKSLSNRG
jgi:hypothetical protein